MNKNIIELNNNQYAISNEDGNIRIVKTKPLNDPTLIEEIFTKENDIEQLEAELDKNKEKLKDLKSKTIFGEIMNILTYAGLISLYILCPLSTIGQIIILAYIYLLSKSFNCLTNGTRIGRFLKKRKTRKNVENIEEYLKNLRNELEQLKINLKYTELTKKVEPEEITKSNYSYNYIFQQKQTESLEIEPVKEIHGLKLTRKPLKRLLNPKVDE